jgi:transcriptional regulator with XRE-family HTH domain
LGIKSGSAASGVDARNSGIVFPVPKKKIIGKRICRVFAYTAPQSTQNSKKRRSIRLNATDKSSDYVPLYRLEEALAMEMKVATNTISRWETGTYEPTLDDLEKLARFFGKSIVQFFPQVEAQDQRSQKVDALLRAAESLQQDDLDELRRYAEFRRARSLQKGTKLRKRS